MLIISKFHDYYDTVLGQGIDKTIVYLREIKEIYERDSKFFIKEFLVNGDIRVSKWGGNLRQETQWHIIGFCGKTYVVLEVKTSFNNSSTILNQSEFYYGLDSLKFLRSLKKEREPKYIIYEDSKNFKSTQNFIEQTHDKENFDLFFRYQSPIFIYTPQTYRTWNQQKEIKVEINICLATYKFFKLFDSFTAFQEISMFISGVLGDNKDPQINLTDKDKIIQHGFDTQWSFRNPNPPSRKQK